MTFLESWILDSVWFVVFILAPAATGSITAFSSFVHYILYKYCIVKLDFTCGPDPSHTNVIMDTK